MSKWTRELESVVLGSKDNGFFREMKLTGEVLDTCRLLCSGGNAYVAMLKGPMQVRIPCGMCGRNIKTVLRTYGPMVGPRLNEKIETLAQKHLRGHLADMGPEKLWVFLALIGMGRSAPEATDILFGYSSTAPSLRAKRHRYWRGLRGSNGGDE